MKKLVLILAAVVLLIACTKSDNNMTINEQNFLVFGHFYGFCGGESCVETFKLTDEKLFEDTIDDYMGQNLEFEELESGLFLQVKP